jgi:hypothetical protein
MPKLIDAILIKTLRFIPYNPKSSLRNNLLLPLKLLLATVEDLSTFSGEAKFLPPNIYI